MSTDKYDRQTRLWGEGQVLINQSRLISISSDSASCEVLKNLVLNGFGFISIVDDQIITKKDIQENFYIGREDEGKKRAEICLSNLLYLSVDI